MRQASVAMNHLQEQLAAKGNFNAAAGHPSRLAQPHLNDVSGGMPWEPLPVTFYEFYESQSDGGISFELVQGG